MSQMRKGTPWANDVRVEKSRVAVAKIVFLICRLLFVGKDMEQMLSSTTCFLSANAISRNTQGRACTDV